MHDRYVVLHAPNQWWSARSGDAVSGIDGIYAGEIRVVGGVLLAVEGGDVEWVGTIADDDNASVLRHHYVIRAAGVADPLVSLTRVRSIGGDFAREHYELANASEASVSLTLTVRLEGDTSFLDAVKLGAMTGTEASIDGLDAGGAEVRREGTATLMRWSVDVPATGRSRVGWSLALAR